MFMSEMPKSPFNCCIGPSMIMPDHKAWLSHSVALSNVQCAEGVLQNLLDACAGRLQITTTRSTQCSLQR